jgi:hypothetical protein
MGIDGQTMVAETRMIPFFPNQIAARGVAVYLVALLAVSLFFWNFAIPFMYAALGVVWVSLFFLLTVRWSRGWQLIPRKQYIAYLFVFALVFRLVWVIASYFYYVRATGIPFEFDAADSMGYHEEAKWLAESGWDVLREYYFGPQAIQISDVGYPLYLTLLYKLFGPGVLLPRCIKALLSSFTCYLLYLLAGRTFGEGPGRMAGVMCALMPNLVIYCGYHLKETEMLFLEVAFLERADFLFRTRKTDVWTILLPTLLGASLFLFRTVLGAAAVFAFVTGIVLSSLPSLRRGWKRTALIGWGILCLFMIGGGTVMTEMEGYWEQREENLAKKRSEQVARGNQWAMYATGTVMAPIAVVLPFSTMVDTGQTSQLVKNGGNYVRNFMGIFAILAVIEAIRRKKWRDYAFIGSFVVAYLGVVSLSGFSNAERFLLPGLPGLILLWTYGVATLRNRTFKLLAPWCLVVLLMEIGWAYFKLGSRGLF